MNKQSDINVVRKKMVVTSAIKNIAVQNDYNSEIITICIPRYFKETDLSQYTILLKAKCIAGVIDVNFTSDELSITDEDIIIKWTLRTPVTSYSGPLKIQISIFGDDFKWQTEIAEVNIASSIKGEPLVPQQLELIEKFSLQVEEKMNIMDEKIKHLEDLISNVEKMLKDK